MTKDETVLKVTSQVPEWKSWGFQGWIVWVRRITYSAIQNSPEKTISERA